MKKSLFSFLALLLLAHPVSAADEFMTGDEMKALLTADKTINLGGDGEGYAGTLLLKADGTGAGVLQLRPGLRCAERSLREKS